MFIDANVFIIAYMDSHERGKRARALLEKIRNGEQNAVTSALVMNEALYRLKELKGIAMMERIYRNISSFENLTILPIDGKTVGASMAYIRDGLEVSDAFHAATMKNANVDVICSFDPHFDKAKGIKRREP